MITALQQEEMPSNPDFSKAAITAVDDCTPSVEKAGIFSAHYLNDPGPQIPATEAEGVGNLRLQRPDIAKALDHLSKDSDRAVREAAVIEILSSCPPDDEVATRAGAERLVTPVLGSGILVPADSAQFEVDI
jgi:hypothetical protein